MSSVGPGPMLIVDAGALCEVLLDGPGAGEVGSRLAADPDLAAPHVIDVEAFGVIRRADRLGLIDRSEAGRAVEDLASWPATRFGHRLLLERAFELRDNVRGWDAMYVALAEVLDSPLLTTDRRLARADGPRCAIELVGASP